MTESASPIVPRIIAHLSDLHIGHSPERLRVAVSLRDRLRAVGVDHVLVTGDTTDHGRDHEYKQFQDTFAEFIDAGQLTILPGNHDRTGDETARHMMDNRRVDVVRRPGLHLVVVDSTGPHNRTRIFSHGKIDRQIIDEIDRAVAAAELDSLVIVALHHHLIPQPGDMWVERFATMLRLPFAEELRLGQDLVRRLVGRCDLILHGHRHRPLETQIAHTPRPLAIYNAGSSTELGKFRIFRWSGTALLGQPEWCV